MVIGWVEEQILALGTLWAVAQVVALINCALACVCSFAKNKNLYLALQIAVNVLYGVHYALLGAYAGSLCNVASIIKLIYIAIRERQGHKINNTEMVVLMIISAGLGFIGFDGVFSLIPLFNSVIFTYAICQDNKAVLRGIVALCCALWVVYGIYTKGYVAAVFSFCEMVFNVFNCIKFLILPKKSNGENLDEQQSVNNDCQNLN